MKTLEEFKAQQERELKMFELEHMLAKKFNNWNFETSVLGKFGNHITILIRLSKQKLSDINAQLLDIIKVLPPTEETCVVTHGSTKYEHQSPFMLKTTSNFRREDEVYITYTCGDKELNIYLPTDYYSDDVLGYFTRKVTDSEFTTYFDPSYGAKEVRNYQIKCREFIPFKTIKWYGGSTYCITTIEDDRSEYEHIAFTGHLKESTTHWIKMKQIKDNTI